MEIRHFRYFLAVARYSHLTRAAEQLGIAPPTLSRQIQEMEAALGVRLFLRQQRGVTLTAAGEAFQQEALLAVQQFEAAQLSAQRAGRGETGHIEMGYVASAAYSGVLQRHVSGFKGEHSAMTLNVREALMVDVPQWIASGQLDLAYVRSPMLLPEALAAVDLGAEPFVLALPESSWLHGLKQINAAHLVREIFILPEQISGTLAIAESGGFVPRLGVQPGGLVAVLTLVSLGQGVAIVPESVMDHVCLPHVVYRRIADSQASSWLSLIHRRFEKAPVVERYIAWVKRIANASG